MTAVPILLLLMAGSGCAALIAANVQKRFGVWDGLAVRNESKGRQMSLALTIVASLSRLDVDTGSSPQ